MALAAGYSKFLEIIKWPDTLITPIISVLLDGAFVYFLIRWIYDLKNRQDGAQMPAEKISRKKDLKILGIIFGTIFLLIIVACIISYL